ncbi:hypothetical protein [Caulobacter sp. S45]|uniref:hypothetical protein n=1 Tax=Caulobacter sp. S45 TaxID=1641861 RepID=UPI0015754BF5|nr:hypothetical protein [Caulobacter sp. S45]
MVDVPEYDDQDLAEVFDEDNTNEESQRHGGKEDAEQFEDLPDVYDVTTKVGDGDDDEGEIGEDMDDDEIVAASADGDEDDEEDDDLKGRFGESGAAEDPADENDLGPDDPDLADNIDKKDPHEVELTYAGDLTNVAGAGSSAAELESDTLDDDDLRDLDYKD